LRPKLYGCSFMVSPYLRSVFRDGGTASRTAPAAGTVAGRKPFIPKISAEAQSFNSLKTTARTTLPAFRRSCRDAFSAV